MKEKKEEDVEEKREEKEKEESDGLNAEGKFHVNPNNFDTSEAEKIIASLGLPQIEGVGKPPSDAPLTDIDNGTTAAPTTTTTTTTTTTFDFECDANELRAHPKRCDKYVHCSHGVAWVMSCPGGLHFNPKTQMCGWERCKKKGRSKA